MLSPSVCEGKETTPKLGILMNEALKYRYILDTKKKPLSLYTQAFTKDLQHMVCFPLTFKHSNKVRDLLYYRFSSFLLSQILLGSSVPPSVTREIS